MNSRERLHYIITCQLKKTIQDIIKLDIISLLVVTIMVLYAIFNNISVISWWLILLVEEAGVLSENHVASH
jgi:uncharacterized membrane protein